MEDLKKLSPKESAEIRANLYELALDAIELAGFETEPIKGGALIHLNDGYFAKLAISACDVTKFNLENTRAEYQAQLAKRAEAAQKAAIRAAEKAEKEAKAAAKKAKAN